MNLRKVFSALTSIVIGWIVLCAVYNVFVVSYYDPAGQAYEGFADDGSRMTVLFSNKEKIVMYFDNENRLSELWKLSCKARKWEWYGLWFYIKPNVSNNSDNDGLFALLRLRFRGMHDIPTTLVEKVVDYACENNETGYYSSVIAKDSFTEEAVFESAGLTMGNASMKRIDLGAEVFKSLFDSVDSVFSRGLSKSMIGKQFCPAVKNVQGGK